MNASSAFIGDFTKLIVGIRNNLVLKVLNERYAEFDQAGFLGAMRYTIAPTHEQAFGMVSGIVPRAGALT